MARKGWDSLSTSYRERLEQGGIDRASYGRGESLSSARGHGATPERPLTNLENVPSRYQGYADLRREIVQLKRSLLQASGRKEYPGWVKNTLKEIQGKSKTSLEKARDILDARVNQNISYEDLRMLVPQIDDVDWDWVLYYH